MTDRALTFEAAGSTDTGRVRRFNEDAFLIRTASGLWAVSDGMGGHEAGRLASSLVVESLESIQPQETPELLLTDSGRRLSLANMRLKRIAQDRGYDIIGATVVVLLAHGREYSCVWSGDSRIYRVRDGAIEQLTRDHSEAEELVARGILTREEVKFWPRRNVITRAIGVADTAEVEVVSGELRPEDVYVLCSDGLTGHVEDEEIRAVVGDPDVDVQTASDRLIALTLDRGAKDNVTAVVVRVRRREPTVLDTSREIPSGWTSSS